MKKIMPLILASSLLIPAVSYADTLSAVQTAAVSAEHDQIMTHEKQNQLGKFTVKSNVSFNDALVKARQQLKSNDHNYFTIRDFSKKTIAYTINVVTYQN